MQSTPLFSQSKNIFEVIGRMELTQRVLETTEPRLVPFHYTYTYVTKGVATKMFNKKAFIQPKALEKIDIEFAQLYARPLKNYLQGKQTTPWREYYNYTKQKHWHAFLAVLLGIHVHINADLCLLLAQSKANRKDFQAVNDVLHQTMPALFRFLTLNEHDIVGFGGMLAPTILNLEFEHIIVRWREEAWQNAALVRSGKLSVARLHEYCEKMSLKIIEEGNNIYKPHHWPMLHARLQHISLLHN